MSTMPTEGASFSIALASSTVRFGRRMIAAKSAPPARLTALALLSMIVLGPSSRIMLRSDSSKPRMSDVIPRIEVIPMTTPRIVSADRILFVRSVSSAITNTSRQRPLFTSQCLDGIERCRSRRGVRPEEEADGGRDADAEHNRPHLEPSRQWRERRDRRRGQRTEADSDQSAECRQRDRLRQHLRHDVLALRAERLAQPDLTRAFADDHQHDVHDDDSADNQRQRDDADEDGEDSARYLPVEIEDRLGREDAEVVRLLWLQSAADTQRHRGVVH